MHGFPMFPMSYPERLRAMLRDWRRWITGQWRHAFCRKRWYKCLDCGTIWASRQRVDRIDPHVIEWHGETRSDTVTVAFDEPSTGVSNG